MALSVGSPALHQAAAQRKAFTVTAPVEQAAAKKSDSKTEGAAKVSRREPVPAHRAVPKDSLPPQEGKFSFFDLLDIVNPLQHIPIVNTVYRAITGDQINSASRVVGGALFGGPVGALLGGVNAVVASENQGKDIGALAMHKAGLSSKETVQDTIMVADVKKDDRSFALSGEAASKEAKAPVTATAWQVNEIKAQDKVKNIIWDDTVAVLPAKQDINALPALAGLSRDMDAAALNDLEPGAEPYESSSAEAPVTPLAKGDIAAQMAAAWSKYQILKEDDEEKGVIAAKDKAAQEDRSLEDDVAKNLGTSDQNKLEQNEAAEKIAVRTRRPFAGLEQVRRY